MNILLLTPFEPDEHRGNSVAACRLATGFRAAGHPTRVLCAARPETLEALATPATLDQKPDLVLIMHAWRCAQPMAEIRQWPSPPPLVVSLRGTDLNEMLHDPATRSQILDVLSASQAIVVFHDPGRERLVCECPAWSPKIAVIPNGAELPKSNIEFRARLGIPLQALVFVSVAGLREVKRPLLVLPWLNELRAERMSIALLHAGQPLEPDVTGSFHAFAHEHPWVYHLDHVPHAEIDSLLRAGNIFLATSRSEGMPHAVREAMLSGMPLLLSDIEGHRTVAIPEKEALFFSTRAEFLQQARRLCSDRELCTSLGREAQRRASAETTGSREIAAYLSLFSTLLDAAPGSCHGSAHLVKEKP